MAKIVKMAAKKSVEKEPEDAVEKEAAAKGEEAQKKPNKRMWLHG